MTSDLRRTLADALPMAMKARERAKVAAVRNALSAVANAEAVDGSGVGPGAGAFATEIERRRLTEPEVHAIVRELRDELQAASVEMARLGQERRADELAGQVEALDSLLGD